MSGTMLLLGKAVFGLGGLAAGLHLARQARREPGFPVHLWASAIIFVGGTGLIGFGLAPLLGEGVPGLAGGLMSGFDLLERAALFGLALFVWRVFGAGRLERRAVLAVVGGLLVVDWIHVLSIQRWPEPIDDAASDAASQLVFALPVAWSSLEAGLEYLRSRRQRRLGLCTALASVRFALWSAGCGALAGVCLLAAVAALSPEHGPVRAATEWLRAALYVGITTLVWLGFFPPEFYRRRLEAPREEPQPA